MDLQAKRKLWNTLKSYRRGRIILLTTHYMDEAEILGDRIGIMHQGKMTCVGSSAFLKQKFGVGYNLTVIKGDSRPNIEILPYLQRNLGSGVKFLSEIK
jgi:ATP-binding cassette subfamily A (ABC1) protein 3